MNKFLALSLLLVAAPVLAEENAPAAEVTRSVEIQEAPAPKKQVEATDEPAEVTRAIEAAPEAPAANQESN